MTFKPDYLCHPKCAAQDALAEQLEARKRDADEIERLRNVINYGCNAIRDAVAVSGGDLKRIDAVQCRMRREMSTP